MVKIKEGFGWDRIKDKKIREAVRALLELAEASDECVIIHLMGKSTEYVPRTMAYVEPSILEFVSEAFIKASDSSILRSLESRVPESAESQRRKNVQWKTK